MTIRECAKSRGFEVIGKLTRKTEAYGIDRKQIVYIDEAGNKYYPDNGDACGFTIVTTDGKII